MSLPHMAASPGELISVANRLRFEVTRMIARARSCHVGSCLSVMDILVALYGSVMRRSADPDDCDRMILSKGHAAAALYAVLAEYGYIPAQRLNEYLEDGSPFIAHTNTFGVSGVEFSTGSLGHGPSVANGIALAGRMRGHRTAFSSSSQKGTVRKARPGRAPCLPPITGCRRWWIVDQKDPELWTGG